MSRRQAKNKRTGILLGLFTAGMIGLAFASVPLYQLFCQVTGYGGTPRTGDQVAAVSTGGDAAGRTITVSLDANVNPDLKWRFVPERNHVDIRLGEESLVFFRAENLSDEPVTGTAVFNVTPFKAAEYVAKVECFCFTEQRLAAGEEARMPVSFFVDPAIAEDPNTSEIRDIVLSYTFYTARNTAEAGGTAAESEL